uniref:BPTI/Kunitz inhibitor domain-containing protein n=1 Tax=Vombatus ursinus TaxID=29139 RepID=A0A4X2KHA9_VOMUR
RPDMDSDLTTMQGPCRAFTPRWYYDFKSNTCGLFLYGGCGGNNNNFQSKTDCLETCSGKSKPENSLDIWTQSSPRLGAA